MQFEQYEHLHSHLKSIEERLAGLDTALHRLARLEIITSLKELSTMAKQSDAIKDLGTRFDSLSGVVTDIHSDFEALRAVMESERENLSEAGQAALDAANAKADAVAQQLTDLDVEVGDADGSDIPTGGGAPTGDGSSPEQPGVPATEPTAPAGDAPPAGEGTVVNPDVPADGGDSGLRPTV